MVIKIKLNSKKYKNKFALIDSKDYDLIKNYTWHYDRHFSGMARTNIDYKHVTMHRLIMKPKENEVIDHINHDTLDNRRSNMRICNQSQNMANRKPKKGKKYKGICKRKKYDKWRAEIRVNKKHISLGDYNTPKEAAIAYNKAAVFYFGNFAYLNKI